MGVLYTIHFTRSAAGIVLFCTLHSACDTFMAFCTSTYTNFHTPLFAAHNCKHEYSITLQDACNSYHISTRRI